MIEVKQLKDYLGLNTIGFFQRIDAQLAALTEPVTPPWSSYITSAELDKLYYLNHKKKLVSDWWEDMEGDTDAGKDAIASELWGIYGVKWSHLFKIFQAQYDPLENYDRQEDTTRTLQKAGTETTEHGGTDTTSRDLSRTGQDTETRTPDITRETTRSGQDTETRTPDLTNSSQTTQNDTDTTNKRAAFNSSDPVVTDTSKVEQKDNRTDRTTGTDETVYERDTTDTESETGTEQVVSAKGTTDSEETRLTRDSSDTLTHDTVDTERVQGRIHGNIGVTTAAQMMKMDKDAWDSLKLIEGMLMADLNEQLTLPIY